MGDKTKKRYYWIKLKTDFFSREDIDFLLSQKNGAEYVVLYQMLCLNTANNNGKLESQIGEMIVRFDAEKVVRDCKYFDIDTVNVAMSLYKQMGLIYAEEDGTLRISEFDNLVGSESSSAKRVREYRERQKVLQCNTNVTQEYRDKSIEYRDIDNKEKKENVLKENKEKNTIHPSDEDTHSFTLEQNEIFNKIFNKFNKLYKQEGKPELIELTKTNKKRIISILNKGYIYRDISMVIMYLHDDWVNHPEKHKTDMSIYWNPDVVLQVAKFPTRLQQAQIWYESED